MHKTLLRTRQNLKRQWFTKEHLKSHVGSWADILKTS